MTHVEGDVRCRCNTCDVRRWRETGSRIANILLARSEPWMDRANCKDVGTDLFFPGRGDNVSLRAAKAVCGLCVVRDECLEYALERGERFGVFGGMSERERRRIRTQRRRAS